MTRSAIAGCSGSSREQDAGVAIARTAADRAGLCPVTLGGVATHEGEVFA